MKILHLSTSDLQGGAARAANRLHSGILNEDVDSMLLVEKKESNDAKVTQYQANCSWLSHLKSFIQFQLLNLKFQQYRFTRPKNLELFSHLKSRHCNSILEYVEKYDIVNLHWISGFLDYEEIFPQLPLNKPIVWTLHDMNPFTGGCHYSGGCPGFIQKCGNCPQLGSNKVNDLSQAIWDRKNSSINLKKNITLHIVAPSKWLAEEARKSSLFRGFPVTVIPNGIDTDVFYPRESSDFRRDLGIPDDSVVVGFVADTTRNRRKGFHNIREVFEKLNNKNVYLVSVGKNRPDFNEKLNHIHLGSIESDSKLSLIYSLFDIYVCASVEDNLPNTVIESIACGTPVIGFNIGGIPDMVVPGETGYLVNEISRESLKSCLEMMLFERSIIGKMSVKCREKALLEFSLKRQANKYLELYRSLL